VPLHGEAHPLQAAPSDRHSNREPDSEDANANVAAVDEAETGGPDEIVVSGGVVSVRTISLGLRRAMTSLGLRSRCLKPSRRNRTRMRP
jgi:hypothetical protein